jgi:hypothetical protein
MNILIAVPCYGDKCVLSALSVLFSASYDSCSSATTIINFVGNLPQVLDQERLLKAIREDLKTCQEAAWFDLVDENAKERSDVEFSTLTTHLMWAEAVGNNQTELERILHSLEENPFLRRYPSWRNRARDDAEL